MPRFRFRLETLRRLREIHRDEMRGRLAEAYAAEKILAEQRSKIDQELGEAAVIQRQLMSGGTLDVNQLLTTQRYQLLLEAQKRVLAEQAARLAVEAENRRLAVVEADRQVRVLDKLEDRKRREHDAARARAEMKQYDEIAVIRRGRPTR